MPQPAADSKRVLMERIQALVDDLSKESGRSAVTEAMVKQINTDLAALCAAIPLDAKRKSPEGM